MELEHFFTCPYCWEEISFVLDLTVEDQTYIEDCEVCCHPIHVSYSTSDNELDNFFAETTDE